MLIDSNVIIRTLQPRSPQLAQARDALRILRDRDEPLALAEQNLVEIWTVATRPQSQNGLGYSIEQAAAELTRLKAFFIILSASEKIYPFWESLVIQFRVAGKQAHDARLVAAMKVHGLRSILTFDTSDFKRFPGIEVIHPADVISPAAER